MREGDKKDKGNGEKEKKERRKKGKKEEQGGGGGRERKGDGGRPSRMWILALDAEEVEKAGEE